MIQQKTRQNYQVYPSKKITMKFAGVFEWRSIGDSFEETGRPHYLELSSKYITFETNDDVNGKAGYDKST